MSGARHWRAQRLGAIALLPLGFYVIFHLIALAGADQATILSWLSRPFAFGVNALFVIALFHHLALGLQVVIEDYVPHRGLRLAGLILLALLAIGAAATALTALFTIAFLG